MKINISFILTIILFSCSQLAEAASASPPRVTVTATAYANHVIIHTFYINEKVYALLDDNSLWEFNPDHTDLNENHDYLINQYITIMPDTGTLIYPVTFIISNKTESFTVNLISIPSNGLQLTKVDALGEFLILDIPEKNHPQLVEISPDDREIVKKWQEGQKVVVGGVWFPEFDPQGRSDCGHLYSLYNYETKEFTRFDYR